MTFLPAIRAPFMLDDFLHAAMVDGRFPAHRTPLDLYDFVGDDDRAKLFAEGIYPWWTHPKITIRFFRPLASALLWAGHRLAGPHPLLPHLVSFGWWVVAVVAMQRLVRRRFSPRVTLFATLCFAFAPCHAIPLAWLANFVEVMSLAFGLIALDAYAEWRTTGGGRPAFVATLSFSLGLLSGEYTLCFGGYVVAIELFARRQTIARRLFGMLPFIGPAAAYLITRQRLGYGTFGSGFYIDPTSDPLAFLRAAPWRFLALVSDGWFAIDTDVMVRDAEMAILATFVAVAFTCAIGPLRRALTRLEEVPRETAKWLMVGSPLALLPVLAVVPSARLVGPSLLGVAVVVALLFDQAWFTQADLSAPRRASAEIGALLATVLAYCHFIHGPTTAWLRATQVRDEGIEFSRRVEKVHDRMLATGATDMTILRALRTPLVFYARFALEEMGTPPSRWRVLTQTGHLLVVHTAPQTLEMITAADHSVVSNGTGSLFRADTQPFRVGEVLPFQGGRATIMALGDAGPRDVRFVFDTPTVGLDDPALTATSPGAMWELEDFDGFHEATLPPLDHGKPFDPW